MDTYTKRQEFELATQQLGVLTLSGRTDFDDADLLQTPQRLAHMPGDSTDSGYASSTTTPDDKSEHNPSDQVDFYSAPARRRLFPRKVKLKQFNVAVPQHVRDRFREVVKLVDRPLYEYLRRECVRPGPVSITLKHLGEDEARVSPWIVVLCENYMATRIRHWFNTEAVKSHCSPDDAVSEVKFDVPVHGRPPRTLSAVVYGANTGYRNWHTPGLTLCGRAIRVGDPDYGRMATLGGLLKISWESNVAFYGITVNHIFQDMDYSRQHNKGSGTPSQLRLPLIVDTTSSFKQLDDRSEELYDEFVFELDVESDDEAFPDGNYLMLPDTVQHDLHWTRVGSTCHEFVGTQCNRNVRCEKSSPVVTAPELDQGRARRLDWSLISIDDATKYWSNRLRTPGLKLDLKLGFDKGCETGLGRDVWISSSISGLESGTILSAPVFLTLEYDLPMIEVYGLTVVGGKALQPGDCGSWIIDQASGEIYGHVVAIDVFKTVYVLPFSDMLNDIKQSLNATDIALPTHEDLKSYWRTLPKDTEHQPDAPKNDCSLIETGLRAFVDFDDFVSYAESNRNPVTDSGYSSMNSTPTSFAKRRCGTSA